MNGKYRMRYYLGHGRNYNKWQLKFMSPIGNFALSTDYKKPGEFTALLHNCKLKSLESTAKRIFRADDKTLSAWIEFEDYTEIVAYDSIVKRIASNSSKLYSFDPDKHSHWVSQDNDNEDGAEVDTILVHKKTLYGLPAEK